MASSEKKKKRLAPEESKAASEYYELHTDAVKDLVEANEENSPEVSEEELRKYQSGPKLRIPGWIKAVLVKMWFAGSVCFFIFWGLSTYLTAHLDLMLVFAIALGVVTDILTNNILRFMAKGRADNDRFMMFPKKRYLTFIWNIFYAMLLLVCVDVLYNLINIVLAPLSADGRQVLGVGPILFGVFYTGFDLLFILMKRTMIHLVQDAKRKTEEGG
ncbi:MAG: hypothetical protein J6P72_04495 [Firmicutes bacterium]|nr:hypothetical protein [Bacillota bacterium]